MANPLPCTEGYYQDLRGNETNLICKSCPQGKYCPTQIMTSPENCSVGHFQNHMNSIFCLPCTAGSYQNNLGSPSCKACPAGSYCPEMSVYPTDCPAGTYREWDGLNGRSVEDCITCPPGSYCLAGSHSITLCPEGFYKTEFGATELTDCSLCDIGSYCPVGSTEAIKCPNGKYLQHKENDTIPYQETDCQGFTYGCASFKGKFKKKLKTLQKTFLDSRQVSFATFLVSF